MASGNVTARTPDEELGALESILVRLDAASESIEPGRVGA